MSQEGKVALITGGLGGIGLSFGENLLQQGAKVTLVDIQDGTKIQEELREKYGENKVLVIKCDITNVELLRAAYQKTIDAFGGLDIVINSAGLVDEVNYERTIAVMLTSVITSSYMAVERMRKDKGGRGGTLINIASIAALTTKRYVLAYSATKGGVVSFDKSLVANLGDGETTGIKVGTICPGIIETNLVILEKPKFQESDVTQPDAEKNVAIAIQEIADSEATSPQRLSEAMIKYLAEPDLHGSVIVVDAGAAYYVHPENLNGQKIDF